MARIRTLKPSFWASPTVSQISRDARLLAAGLVSFADDDGRFVAGISGINGYVFPNDDLPNVKVAKWLAEVQASGFAHLYDVDGGRYGCLPTWHLHQVINRYTPSKFPPPTDVECAPRKKASNADD